MSINSFKITFGVAVLSLSTAVQASVVGAAVERMDFSNGYVLADGSTVAGADGTISAGWAAFDAFHDVYRVYAVTDDPVDVVAMIAGSQDFGFDLTFQSTSGVFWNHALGSNSAPNLGLISAIGDPTMAFDTFLTMGYAEQGGGPGLSFVGAFDLSGDFAQQNVGYFVLPPDALPSVDQGDGTYRTLVGQFAVSEGDDLWGQVRIVGVGLGNQNFETFASFSTIPSPATLALLGLAGLAGARRRRRC